MNWLYVGLGGFLGASLRYGMSRWILVLTKDRGLPIATLCVNLLGCFLIGWLASTLEARSPASATPLRLFLLVGLLGGFTTYSTFAYELFTLGREGDLLTAVMNAGLHLVLGVAAVALGVALAR